LREISVILDGAVARLRRERNENMILAWHIVALDRMKRFPKLDDLLQTEKRPTGRRQTPEQIEATVRGWLGSRHRK